MFLTRRLPSPCQPRRARAFFAPVRPQDRRYRRYASQGVRRPPAGAAAAQAQRDHPVPRPVWEVVLRRRHRCRVAHRAVAGWLHGLPPGGGKGTKRRIPPGVCRAGCCHGGAGVTSEVKEEISGGGEVAVARRPGAPTARAGVWHGVFGVMPVAQARNRSKRAAGPGRAPGRPSSWRRSATKGGGSSAVRENNCCSERCSERL